jgi:hypothetical protein
MPATLVRLVVEYRNGDKNFLGYYSGEFVKCHGETDEKALRRAFSSLITAEQKRLARVGLHFKGTDEARSNPSTDQDRTG